ncbi:MAG: hypothetical protein OHK0038_20500 [Flammeovirgaceae bacterium]
MNYPSFSFDTHEYSFDKDAQGAHEYIVEFRNHGEDFVHITKNFDAYDQKWSIKENKGKIIAYFPERQLVKLKYENGDISFLELNNKKIDNWKTPIYIHFWFKKNFFPLAQDRVKELTNLFSSLLSVVENKNIRFTPPKVENLKWSFSDQQADFMLGYWLSEEQENFKFLEIKQFNNTSRQVPFSIRIGAYISNLFIQYSYLNDYQVQINQLVADFVKENSSYSLQRIQK